MNIRSDDISESEKKCLKNCTTKYLEQFSILNSFKDTYSNKFGTEIFISNKNNKDAFTRLIDILSINNMELDEEKL